MVFVLISALAIGCSSASPPPEPIHLKAITLGTAVDGDQRIGTPTRTFGPDATVYASIKTEGSGTTTLHITWAGAGGKRLHDEDRTVTGSGPTFFAFQFKPEGGWTPGVNRISFALGDEQRHTAEFEIR
jgi:hypothetical protein